MVGEFPELQGVIGGYLARAQGEPEAVADAIRDHYKPVGQGDEVPTAPVTVAVALADKLDSLICFFAIDEKPRVRRIRLRCAGRPRRHCDADRERSEVRDLERRCGWNDLFDPAGTDLPTSASSCSISSPTA